MAVKKRTTLRSKSSKRVGPNVASLDNEKQKKETLLNKIAEKEVVTHTIKTKAHNDVPSDPNQAGISKSAIRRRKRKLRDQLRPKLTDDLLDALTESTNTVINKGEDGIEEVIISEKVKLDHTPNPQTKRGQMALFKLENEQFKEVLRNKQLRTGGVGCITRFDTDQPCKPRLENSQA